MIRVSTLILLWYWRHVLFIGYDVYLTLNASNNHVIGVRLPTNSWFPDKTILHFMKYVSIHYNAQAKKLAAVSHIRRLGTDGKPERFARKALQHLPVPKRNTVWTGLLKLYRSGCLTIVSDELRKIESDFCLHSTMSGKRRSVGRMSFCTCCQGGAVGWIIILPSVRVSAVCYDMMSAAAAACRVSSASGRLMQLTSTLLMTFMTYAEWCAGVFLN